MSGSRGAPLLLLGGSGLLGGAFRRALAGRDAQIAPKTDIASKTEIGARTHIGEQTRGAAQTRNARRVQIANRADIAIERLVDGTSILHRTRFACVINCIAHTRVEAAEDAVAESFRINALLPGLVAAACRETGARMVHVSSTGAYGTGQDEPWDDYATPRPATVHHRSKIAGEEAVRAELPGALILRTGWLYGPPPHGRTDFVAMIAGQATEAASRGAALLSDGGQRGNPTLTDDVAGQALALLDAGIGGTYNCVAGGVVRRLDYVSAIVAALGLAIRVEQAPPGHFKRRAPVSPNEGAVNLKLQQMGLDRMPDWHGALCAHIAVRGLEPGLEPDLGRDLERGPGTGATDA